MTRISKTIIFATPLLVLFVLPALASTGTLLVVNKSDDTVSMLDLATGESMATLGTGRGPHEVAVSPDGATALVSNYGVASQPGNSLTVIDIQAAKVVATIDLGGYLRPHGLAWMPDNRHALVTAEDSRSILLVNIKDRKLIRAIMTEEPVSHMVATDPSGKHAYISNIGSGSVSIVDIAKGILKTTHKVGNGTEGIAISPDGTQLWVTNRESDTVVVLDRATMEILRTFDTAGFPIRVAVSPDGQEALVSCAHAGRVEFYNTRTLQSSGELSMPREYSLSNGRLLGGWFGYRPLPIGILYHPDGKSAYVANGHGGYIAGIDTTTRKVSRILHAGTEPDGMAHSQLMPGKPDRY